MHSSTHRSTPRVALGVLTLAGVLAVTGCGGDDDAADDPADTTAAETAAEPDAPETTAAPPTTAAPETTAAPPTTAAPETTAAPPTTGASEAPATTAGEATAAGYDDFCQAELAVEAAIGSNGDVPGAFEALAAASPADARPVVERTIELASAFLADDGEPTPEFFASYGEMMDIVKSECGFTELDVAATNYAFGGVPESLPAGPVVVTFDNLADEYHEFVILRKQDGVTLSATELLELPEEEAMTMVEQVSGAFAPPGQVGYTATELEAGDYVAVCFIPEGATEEAFASGVEPDGMPHAMLGMVAEFTVG